MKMRYASVCSGVEAPTVAWHPLGWKPQFFSEIEKFPSAVLEHHYPDVPNHGDMLNYKDWPDYDKANGIQLLVGGTPCQSFSVAGLRKGLDDPRGNLMLTFLGVAKKYNPKWIIWENVPGVLSSNQGRDFGTFLTALGQIGYGFAYRVLDAQYFGVAQRRRRVFVVGHSGDWRCAAAVLFEQASLRGDPAPSREEREAVAKATTRGTPVNDPGRWPAEVASTLNAYFGEKQGLEDQHINDGAPLFVPSTTGPLTAGMHKGPRGTEAIESNHVIVSPRLRRLTPRECERLQGFSDDYTRIPWRNKAPEDCPDGPRYKAMGNSMAVPVMRWIGERIEMVEELPV